MKESYEENEKLDQETINIVEDTLAAQDPLIGTVLDGRYQILSMIGKGASSSVYKAEDSRLKHLVAVKLLHSHLLSDVEIVNRFKKEAHTASVIVHPNAVAVHDCSVAPGGQPFLVMDYVEGISLEQVLRWL